MLVENIFNVKFYLMHKWDIKILNKQIGIIFQLARLRLNLSQLSVANELNLSANQIGRIERGETNPTIKNVLNIANYFNIEMKLLFQKITDEKLESMIKEIENLKIENKNKNR